MSSSPRRDHPAAEHRRRSAQRVAYSRPSCDQATSIQRAVTFCSCASRPIGGRTTRDSCCDNRTETARTLVRGASNRFSSDSQAPRSTSPVSMPVRSSCCGPVPVLRTPDGVPLRSSAPPYQPFTRAERRTMRCAGGRGVVKRAWTAVPAVSFTRRGTAVTG